MNPFILIILNNNYEVHLFREYLKPFKKIQTPMLDTFALNISESLDYKKASLLTSDTEKLKAVCLRKMIGNDWEEIFGTVTGFSIKEDLYTIEYLRNEILDPDKYFVIQNFNFLGFEKGKARVSNISKEIFNTCNIVNVITPDGTFWNFTHAELPNGRKMAFHTLLSIKDIIQKNISLHSSPKHPIEQFDYWPLDKSIIEQNWELLKEYFLSAFKDCHAILLKWEDHTKPGYADLKPDEIEELFRKR